MAQNDNPPLTVSQLLGLRDNDWVNDGFMAVVRSMERKASSKTGKTFWKLELADTTGSGVVKSTMFFAPKFNEGDQVIFTGAGIKFKNGQYGPEVSIGDKAQISVLGRSAHHAEQTERAASGKPAVNGEPQRTNGQTVGMAIKEALLLAIAVQPNGSITRQTLADPLFWQDVKVYAGNIIRISGSLERGNLSAPSWPARQPQQAAAPAPKPQPGPDGSAYTPSHDDGEDVPF